MEIYFFPQIKAYLKTLNWKECEFSEKEEKLRDEKIRAKIEDIKNGRKKDRKEAIIGIKPLLETVKSY